MEEPRAGQKIHRWVKAQRLRLRNATPAPINAADAAIRKVPGYIAGKTFGAPLSAFGDTVKNILFGHKQQLGPLRGQRLQYAGGGLGKGIQHIGHDEYSKILSGELTGHAVEGRIGGIPAYFKHKVTSGGLVGMVQRNPGKSLLGAGLLYYLANHAGARQTAGSLASGMLVPEVQENTVHPEVSAQFSQQPSGQSALNKPAWG